MFIVEYIPLSRRPVFVHHRDEIEAEERILPNNAVIMFEENITKILELADKDFPIVGTLDIININYSGIMGVPTLAFEIDRDEGLSLFMFPECDEVWSAAVSYDYGSMKIIRIDGHDMTNIFSEAPMPAMMDKLFTEIDTALPDFRGILPFRATRVKALASTPV